MTIDGISRDSPVFRHAVYAAPLHGHAWELAGAHWLGRQAHEAVSTVSPPRLSHITADVWRSVTAEPRRYGWHATLVAPFQSNRSVVDTGRFFEAVSVQTPAALLPALQLVRMGGFLALVPTQRSEALHALADHCVRSFQTLMTPRTEAELALRRAKGLTQVQDELLQRWGYPYVMQEFRFHFTLTGKLDHLPPSEQEMVWQEAHRFWQPLLTQPFLIDQLSWFVEPQAGADFVCVRQFGLKP